MLNWTINCVAMNYFKEGYLGEPHKAATKVIFTTANQ